MSVDDISGYVDIVLIDKIMGEITNVGADSLTIDVNERYFIELDNLWERTMDRLRDVDYITQDIYIKKWSDVVFERLQEEVNIIDLIKCSKIDIKHLDFPNFR